MKSQIKYPTIELDGLTWLHSDGLETTIIGRIGAPYQISIEEWGCPVELVGVDDQYLDTRGVNSFQSLALAIRLLHTRLSNLIQNGEQIFFSDDRSAPLDLTFLNSLFGWHDRESNY